MKLSTKAQEIYNQIDSLTKLGDLRKIAKEIKVDHELAIELWSTAEFYPRLLAILLLDKKQLNQEVIDGLDADMQIHSDKDQEQLIDWLLANQFTKDKKLITLMLSWENSKSNLQRRTFWYYQGRLRWMGQPSPENTTELLSQIEKNIKKEDAKVQWAMNFVAGWIGVFDEKYRKRCIAIGETTGLYKGEMVAKNCTPNYLPLFIDIEVNKRVGK